MKRNQFAGLTSKAVWRLLCEAAKRAMEAGGYELARVPGRGLSNVWLFERNGKRGSASIRTSRDRWFAFPPLKGGAKWKTLDDVDVVIVAAVDKADNPEKVEVYIFEADVVRKHFRAAHLARISAGQALLRQVKLPRLFAAGNFNEHRFAENPRQGQKEDSVSADHVRMQNVER